MPRTGGATGKCAPPHEGWVTSEEVIPGGNVAVPDYPLALQEWDARPPQGYRCAGVAEAVLEPVSAPTARHQVVHSRVMTQFGAAAHAAGYGLLPWVAVVTDSAVPGPEKRPVIPGPRYSRES
jgi:hypothetical protein